MCMSVWQHCVIDYTVFVVSRFNLSYVLLAKVYINLFSGNRLSCCGEEVEQLKSDFSNIRILNLTRMNMSWEEVSVRCKFKVCL